MRKPLSWIVVADGHRARILRNDQGNTLEPALDHDYVAPNPRDHETGGDRPGRTHERFGPSSHALDTVDHHRARKAQFLAGLATELDGAALAGRYERLFLVAPPQALGDLRASLGSHAQGRVAGELALDLTHESLHALEERFVTLLA